MIWIALYVIVGVLIDLGIEKCINTGHIVVFNTTEQEIAILRVLVMVFWPVLVTITIIQELFTKDEEDEE